MRDSDIERLQLAAAMASSALDGQALERELDGIPVAPLVQLVSQMIRESSDSPYRPVLEGICSLKQGRIEDLDSPEFRSYLVRNLGITEATLESCIGVIVTYAKVLRASRMNASKLVAARSEDDLNLRITEADDILRELRRRT